MTKKIRVFIANSDPTDVCSYYRTTGPLLADPRYEVTLGGAHMTWADLAKADVMCIARVTSPEELRTIEIAQAAHVPVWVDYDDNMLAVPPTHPNYIAFAQPALQESVQTAIEQADLLTVSTEELRAACRPTAQVVKNGFGRWPKGAPVHTRTPSFYWRGSNTHNHDIEAYAKVIAGAVPKDVDVSVFGWFAWPLIEALTTRGTSKTAYIKELPVNLFFRELEKAMPACCIVPLVDNIFNRCKSNIAQLEALQVGALAIVPDWQEWSLPGAIKYRDAASLEKAVRTVFDIPYEERAAMWKAGIEAAAAQTKEAIEARYAAIATLV